MTDPRSLIFAVTLLVASPTFANDTAAHAAASTAHAPVADSKSIPADTSLGWLKNGNVRFTTGKLRRDGQSKADVTRLSTGQSPHAIVVSCSDSRVPPEVVFDQKLGEIFSVRTAGESVDEAALASIEYAVSHLGSHLILVMGHTSCGAVKAAFGTMDGQSAGSPALDSLVKSIHPHLASFKGKTPSEVYEKESWAQVDGVAKGLLARSQILKTAWDKSEIRIEKALYDLSTGQVRFADTSDLRTPSAETKTPASAHDQAASSHGHEHAH